MKKSSTLSQKRILDGIFLCSEDIRRKMQGIPVSTLIRLLRKRLHMTQKNLAARAGVSQSFVAKIESGHRNFDLQTLKKMFSALFCELFLVPTPLVDFDELIKQQALKAAKKRIEYLKGTMSLEKQLPDPEMLEQLILEEQNRLIQSGSSEIWNV